MACQVMAWALHGMPGQACKNHAIRGLRLTAILTGGQVRHGACCGLCNRRARPGRCKERARSGLRHARLPRGRGERQAHTYSIGCYTHPPTHCGQPGWGARHVTPHPTPPHPTLRWVGSGSSPAQAMVCPAPAGLLHSFFLKNKYI